MEYRQRILTVSINYIENLQLAHYTNDQRIRGYILPALEQEPCSTWLRANDIQLDYRLDDVSTAYCVDIVVYATLTQRQYQEYILRFL